MSTQTINDFSREEEIERLIRLGKALGLDVDEVEKSGSEFNFVAIRTKYLLISRRLDSRTLFIQDFRHGVDQDYGVFKGPDKALTEVGQRIFEKFELPVDEADEWQVLTEQTQTAQVDKAGKTKMGRVASGARILQVNRQVQGIPVWSSNVTLRLSSKGTVAFLQAHWPECSHATLDEGCRLGHLVRHGWQPPAQDGASPENIEAGIRHSPPVSFLMDISPAIRVIYEPWNQRHGRKLTLYFDRHGREIPRIRHAEQLPQLESRQRSSKGSSDEY